MKINYIVTAVLWACVASSAVSAQATTSPMVDSTNKQLLHGGKPPKSGSADALKASTAAAKSSRGAAVKPARFVQVPAITAQATAVSTKGAAVASAADSGSKAAPPVVRAAKVVKAKPPAE